MAALTRNALSLIALQRPAQSAGKYAGEKLLAQPSAIGAVGVASPSASPRTFVNEVRV